MAHVEEDPAMLAPDSAAPPCYPLFYLSMLDLDSCGVGYEACDLRNELTLQRIRAQRRIRRALLALK